MVRKAASAAAVVLALGALLTGCTASSGSPPETSIRSPSATPSGFPAGLSATFQQLRSDVAERTAQVRVSNRGDRVRHITELRVADPRFTEELVRVKDSTLPTGGAVDLRVQLPPMDCDAGDAAEAMLTLTFTDESTASGPLPDPLGVLERLHAAECRAARVAEVMRLSWGEFTPSAAESAAALVLRAEPTGQGGEVVVRSVQSTNLLRFGEADAEVFVVDLEATGGKVAVPLVPQRCDPHVVQEDKRGTVFTLEVEVDGASSVVELPVPPETRARILTWVAQWCGFG